MVTLLLLPWRALAWVLDNLHGPLPGAPVTRCEPSQRVTDRVTCEALWALPTREPGVRS